MKPKAVYIVLVNSTKPWHYTSKAEAFRQARNVATVSGKPVQVIREETTKQ